VIRGPSQAISSWRSRIVDHGNVSPAELVANPKNWRTHPPAQQAALAGLLDQVGWVQDVVVNRRTGLIVDGHLRAALAVEREEATIPVVYVDLDEEEEALVLASLDPLGAMAGVDPAKLVALLGEAQANDEALRAMLLALGGDLAGEKPGLTDPDDVPDAGEPVTQPGDLWLLGPHRVLCGDSTNPADVARVMNGERARLMATDPPYLVDYTAGSHPPSNHNSAGTRDKNWDEYHDPTTSVAFYADFIAAALPHLTERAAIYQWHANTRQAFVDAAWLKTGLLAHQVIPLHTRSE